MQTEYKKTLDFLFSQLPMYQRVGASAMKKNLDNILALCAHLGNPQQHFKSIHIAGTNGKGSVTHILAGILKQANYKVACYTSPHYIDFRERIKTLEKDKPIHFIPEQNVIDFVNKNKGILEQIKPSFFEITVAMAFDFFAQENIDIAIIETGLGGRLDSTNIIHPLLSIITNISKDHTQFLGNTLAEIAFEKAGIIKENTPVIIGKKQKETTTVFKKKAAETQSEMHYAETLVAINNFTTKLGKKTKFELNIRDKKLALETDLAGNYQKENLQTALAALLHLKNKNQLRFQEIDIKNGLQNIQKKTYFLGRNMHIADAPLTIFDSAHNVAGITTLMHELATLHYDTLHFVYGTVSDKDVAKIFTLLLPKAQFYLCKPNIARGMETEKLSEFGKQFSFDFTSHPSVKKALLAAKTQAKKNDLIVVAGSIFVVAEALQTQD